MKRTLTALLALLTALLLIQPAAAARTVPVTVDDALLRQTCYLESGSTLVPLRGLLELLGGWTVSWQSGQAVATNGGRAIQARPWASPSSGTAIWAAPLSAPGRPGATTRRISTGSAGSSAPRAGARAWRARSPWATWC